MRDDAVLFRGHIWNPLREFPDLRRGMSRLLVDAHWMPVGKKKTPVTFVPTRDIEESDEQFLMRQDFPGLNEVDVKIDRD